MSQAGRLGEPLDRGTLDRAIVAVTGSAAEYAGVEVAQQPKTPAEPATPARNGQPDARPSLNAAATAFGAGSAAEAIPPIGETVTPLVRAVTRAAAPVLASTLAAAPAAALSIPFMLWTGNSGSMTFDIGEDLRVRHVPDSAEASIERRIGNGLFGTGLGERWEKVPIKATVDARRTLFVDPGELERAIGTEAMDRLLATHGVSIASDRAITSAMPTTPEPNDSSTPSLVQIALEMQIGITSNRPGDKIVRREATEEEAARHCSRYFDYKLLFDNATENAKRIGLLNGTVHGKAVHREVELKLREAEIRAMLNARGFVEINSEVAFLNGAKKAYRMKGTSVPDVLEADRKGTMCIYEFKTGGATLRKATIERYGRVGVTYADAEKMGYAQVYVVPIYEKHAQRP